MNYETPQTHQAYHPDRTTRRRAQQKKRIQSRRRRATLLFMLLVFAAGCAVGSHLSPAQKTLADEDPGTQTATDTEQEMISEFYTALTGNGQETTGEESSEAQEVADFFAEIPEVALEKPVDYSLREALSRIEEFAGQDERFAAVLEQQEKYPEKLLINLANFPEMIPFLVTYEGITEADQNLVLTEAELEEDCPLFLQWDRRWGAVSYGDSNNIAIAGCGPTSLAMVIAGLTKDKTATPSAVASYAMKNGYYLKGTGTKWDLMTKGAAAYGLHSEQIDISESVMKEYLDAGGLLICSVRKGDFTTGGHFIVIRGYDEDGFLVNDPMSVYRSSRKWTYAQLKKQMKALWALQL